VDIVVAAAGVTKRVPTVEMSDDDWQTILDTNLTGMMRTYRTFAPPMIARRRGRLIGIASLGSYLGLHEVAAYTASKAGVAGLTRALAVEWAPHGLTVNAILPGVLETDMNRELLKGPRGQEFLMRTPMRRFGCVDELVGAAVYLASDAASFVTGQLLAVDGGILASGVNQ
jgi:NAD(P)-dependent dehydrogenase (short-subunit alcohol dehydrogenase family)